MTDHPTNGLDETVHQRHRLGILTIAAEANRADFRYLRDALELTAGNLSRHLTVLEDAGMVRVEKGYEGRRPRTWVRITRQGRSALGAELDALAALVRRHGTAPGQPEAGTTDTRTTDTGAPDTGAPDTEAPDTRAPDTGAPEPAGKSDDPD